MSNFTLQPITTRPPVVITGLALLVIFGFFAVNRLVNRFGEQQKAIARHLYAQGLSEQKEGKADLAIEHFRSALSYSPENFDYQLQLARVLRDTGRTEEAETYLISLWERSPQNGAINLALGRLAARQHSLDKILQYYHNAIYGVWTTGDSDQSRFNAWFELIETLLQQNARPQSQAELITMAAELRGRLDLQLRVANLFARAQDYEDALNECRQILAEKPEHPQALADAGQYAFNLGRYREALHYLEHAVKVNPGDVQSAQLLQLSRNILDLDPFLRRISDTDRIERIRTAFRQAGDRLESCARTKNVDLQDQTSSSPLVKLEFEWLQARPRVTRLRVVDTDFENSTMDLVFQVEQVTQKECGPPSGLDQALLLLAQNPGVEQ